VGCQLCARCMACAALMFVCNRRKCAPRRPLW
jgi:hypothetical protein